MWVKLLHEKWEEGELVLVSPGGWPICGLLTMCLDLHTKEEEDLEASVLRFSYIRASRGQRCHTLDSLLTRTGCGSRNPLADCGALQPMASVAQGWGIWLSSHGCPRYLGGSHQRKRQGAALGASG